jgi:hypothetical protein
MRDGKRPGWEEDFNTGVLKYRYRDSKPSEGDRALAISLHRG